MFTFFKFCKRPFHSRSRPTSPWKMPPMMKVTVGTAQCRSPPGRSVMTKTELSPMAASVSHASMLPVLLQFISCTLLCTYNMTPLCPCCLMLPQSVNMPTVETDTAMKGLRSVMEKTLDTRHVIHIFQGKHTAFGYTTLYCMKRCRL